MSNETKYKYLLCEKYDIVTIIVIRISEIHYIWNSSYPTHGEVYSVQP